MASSSSSPSSSEPPLEPPLSIEGISDQVPDEIIDLTCSPTRNPSTPPLPKSTLPSLTTRRCPIICVICLAPAVHMSVTSCGHVFCHKCIRQSLGVSDVCPTCRTKVSIKQLLPVHVRIRQAPS